MDKKWTHEQRRWFDIKVWNRYEKVYFCVDLKNLRIVHLENISQWADVKSWRVKFFKFFFTINQQTSDTRISQFQKYHKQIFSSHIKSYGLSKFSSYTHIVLITQFIFQHYLGKPPQQIYLHVYKCFEELADLLSILQIL